MTQATGGAKPAPHINIQIDREHFSVDVEALTGAQLRALPDPDIPESRDLFQVVPGGQDHKIAPGETVTLKSGMRFFSAPGQINPGSSAVALDLRI
ncbi:MAG: multiubiquitin domain-containing protein [Nocardioidaceae bacterium]|nr:multiubiquitin domain-containing protein [Nocardioidaceae bacterium]